MANQILSINYIAEGPIPNNRIVKMGATDRGVLVSTNPTDFHIGVLNEMPLGVVLGERVDVVRIGIAWVEAAAAIPRGSAILCDNTGRAIVAAPAVGVNARIIGFAEEAALAAGDVIRFMLVPSQVQG
jgi:hypothetical protein